MLLASEQRKNISSSFVVNNLFIPFFLKSFSYMQIDRI